MIKPLFKYAGGKFKEYTHINRFFSEKINNYYENLLRESPRALAVGVCQDNFLKNIVYLLLLYNKI